MSIQSIIKQGNSKKVKKPRVRSAAGITAYDARYTGSEPIWDGWADWPVTKFMHERNRALNFYNYYSDSSKMKVYATEWMESHGYSKDDVRAVKRAPDYTVGITAGSLCKCMNRGMPPLHPEAQAYHDSMPGVGGTACSDEAFVRGRLAAAIHEGRKIDEPADPTKVAAAGPSPMERLRVKTLGTIILDLDLLLDKWMDSAKEVEVLPIFEKMKGYDLPAAAGAQVEKWISKQMAEYTAAVDKTDEQLVEGYRYLTTKQLKERINACETMLADLGKFKHSEKAERAPRVKKLPSAEKQIKNVKYLKHDEALKISSINPIRIVGAHRVLAYHTKYKVIYDYVSTSTNGLQIKGTSLKNLDESLCRCRTLRKPEDFLTIVQNETAKQIDKAWDALTTKEKKPNGRINEDIILLRVL